jgi:hypothetical protein
VKFYLRGSSLAFQDYVETHLSLEEVQGELETKIKALCNHAVLDRVVFAEKFLPQ